MKAEQITERRKRWEEQLKKKTERIRKLQEKLKRDTQKIAKAEERENRDRINIVGKFVLEKMKSDTSFKMAFTKELAPVLKTAYEAELFALETEKQG